MDPRGPSEATVLALDNVPLELPIAGAGTRALAAFLDYLLVGVLINFVEARTDAGGQ